MKIINLTEVPLILKATLEAEIIRALSEEISCCLISKHISDIAREI
ncbi:MAG: hypothetical protein GX799_01165 [Crenarchaeota archaeon]|nr:hypothetical protein [Thermoproteota archaeon]